MLTTERTEIKKSNLTSTGGGGTGRGGGNIRYYGKGGDSSKYEQRSQQAANSILGPQEELLNLFKKRVGVSNPFRPGLIDPERAGKAKRFGDDTVPDYVQNMKEYSAGLKKTFNGDVAIKEQMVEVGKEYGDAMLAQHGADVDYSMHMMNVTVGMAAQRKSLQWHMRKCQGELDELSAQAGGRF